MLYQIDTGYACAGIEVNNNGIVYITAPIFSWMIGKNIDEVNKWKCIKHIKRSNYESTIHKRRKGI